MFINFLLILVSLLYVSITNGQSVTCPPTGISNVVNPLSCRSFYMCINGNPVPMPCAPNMFFDPVLNACTLTATCNRCFGNPPGNILFLADELVCEEYFICVGGTQLNQRCIGDLHFNAAKNGCDLRENANCPHYVPPETEAPITLPPGGQPPVTPPPNGPGSPLPPIDPNLTVCPQQLPGLLTLADQDLCENYTVCIDGREFPRTCNPGLIYDVLTRACNTRPQGRCVLDAAVQCPVSQGDTVIRLPHPDDCRFHFMCINSTPFLQRCAPELLFDSLTNQCNTRTAAVCAPGAAQ